MVLAAKTLTESDAKGRVILPRSLMENNLAWFVGTYRCERIYSPDRVLDLSPALPLPDPSTYTSTANYSPISLKPAAHIRAPPNSYPYNKHTVGNALLHSAR